MKAAMMAAMLLAIALNSEYARPMSPSANSATVAVWIYSNTAKKMVESRFVVDFATNVATPQTLSTNDAVTPAVALARANAGAYERLVHRFHEATPAERTPDLESTMDKLHRASLEGMSPQAAIVASPNGRYAIVRPWLAIPLVVDLQTLEAHRLSDATELHPTPMAWSGDSKLVALAPMDAHSIVIYDIEHATIRYTLPCRDAWVQSVAWSPDMAQLAVLAFQNRRLHKTPFGLLEAFSGHPDFRNDLVAQRFELSAGTKPPIILKSNVSEQSTVEFAIDWKPSEPAGQGRP